MPRCHVPGSHHSRTYHCCSNCEEVTCEYHMWECDCCDDWVCGGCVWESTGDADIAGDERNYCTDCCRANPFLCKGIAPR